MGLNYCASSPVLLLPPQQPPTYDYFTNHLAINSLKTSPSVNSPYRSPSQVRRKAYKHSAPPSMNYQASATDNHVAGRKRSRDDVADDPPDDGSATPMVKPKVEPIYGPGMTLIYPDQPSLNIAAESQTGTWREEKSDGEVSTAATRPIITARKSQRLVRAAAQPAAVEVERDLQDPTALLPISWKPIPATQAEAVKGHQKYIERHYAFGAPNFVLYNDATQVYLVQTFMPREVYRLFSEDLRQSFAVGYSKMEAYHNITANGLNPDGTPHYVQVEAPVTAVLHTPLLSPESKSSVPINEDAEMMEM